MAQTLKICFNIIRSDPEQKTMLLARTNFIYGIDLKEFIKKLIDILSKSLSVKPEILRKNIIAMTAHGSKGDEKQRVIILDATSKNYPKIHPDNFLFELFGVTAHAVLEDERRLFYVAITRAENKLIMLTDKGNESPYLNDIKNILSADLEKKYLQVNQVPLGEIALRIFDKIKKIDAYNEPFNFYNGKKNNPWDMLRTNVSLGLHGLVAMLEKSEIPIPEAEFSWTDEDGEFFAELAWPHAPTPVAILNEEQMTQEGKWKSQGWKIPGHDLSDEQIMKGLRHYILGK